MMKWLKSGGSKDTSADGSRQKRSNSASEALLAAIGLKAQKSPKVAGDNYFDDIGFLPLPKVSDNALKDALSEGESVRRLLLLSFSPTAVHRVLLQLFVGQCQEVDQQGVWIAPIVEQLAGNLGLNGYSDDFSDDESDGGKTVDGEMTMRARSLLFSRCMTTDQRGIDWLTMIQAIGADEAKASAFFHLLIQHNLTEMLVKGAMSRQVQFCSPVALLKGGWQLKQLSCLFDAHVLSVAVEVLHDCYRDDFEVIFGALLQRDATAEADRAEIESLIKGYLAQVSVNPNALINESVPLGMLYVHCVKDSPDHRTHFFKQLVFAHQFVFSLPERQETQASLAVFDALLNQLFFPEGLSLSDRELLQSTDMTLSQVMGELLWAGVPRQQLITRYANKKLAVNHKIEQVQGAQPASVADLYQTAKEDAIVVLKEASQLNMARLLALDSSKRDSRDIRNQYPFLEAVIQAARVNHLTHFLQSLLSLEESVGQSSSVLDLVYRSVINVLMTLSVFKGDHQAFEKRLQALGLATAEDIDHLLLIQQAVMLSKTLRKEQFPYVITPLDILCFMDMKQREIKEVISIRQYADYFQSSDSVVYFLQAFNKKSSNPLESMQKPEFVAQDIDFMRDQREKVGSRLSNKLKMPVRRGSKSAFTKEESDTLRLGNILKMMQGAAVYFLDLTLLEMMAGIERAKVDFRRNYLNGDIEVADLFQEALKLKVPLSELVSFGAGNTFYQAARFTDGYATEKYLLPEEVAYKASVMQRKGITFEQIHQLLTLEKFLLSHQSLMTTDLVKFVTQARALLLEGGIRADTLTEDCRELVNYLTGVDQLPIQKSSLMKTVETCTDWIELAELLTAVVQGSEQAESVFSAECLGEIEEITEALRLEQDIEQAEAALARIESNGPVKEAALNGLRERAQSDQASRMSQRELASLQAELTMLEQEVLKMASARQEAKDTVDQLTRQNTEAYYQALQRRLVRLLRGDSSLSAPIRRLVRLLESVVILDNHERQHQRDLFSKRIDPALLFAPGRATYLMDNVFKLTDEALQSASQDVSEDTLWQFLPTFLIDVAMTARNYLTVSLMSIYASYKAPSSYDDIVLLNQCLHLGSVVDEMQRSVNAYIHDRSKQHQGFVLIGSNATQQRWRGIALLNNAILTPFFSEIRARLDALDIPALMALAEQGIQFSAVEEVIDYVAAISDGRVFEGDFHALMAYLAYHPESNQFNRAANVLSLVETMVIPFVEQKAVTHWKAMFQHDFFRQLFFGHIICRLGGDEGVPTQLLEQSLSVPDDVSAEALLFFEGQLAAHNENFREVVVRCANFDFLRKLLVMKLVEARVHNKTSFTEVLDRFANSYLFSLLGPLSNQQCYVLLSYACHCLGRDTLKAQDHFEVLLPDFLPIFEVLSAHYKELTSVPYSLSHHGRQEGLYDVLCFNHNKEILPWCDEVLLYADNTLFSKESADLKNDYLHNLNVAIGDLLLRGTKRLHDQLIAQRKLREYQGQRNQEEFYQLLYEKFHPCAQKGTLMLLAQEIDYYKALPEKNNGPLKQAVTYWDSSVDVLLIVNAGSSQFNQICRKLLVAFEAMDAVQVGQNSQGRSPNEQCLGVLFNALLNVQWSGTDAKKAEPPKKRGSFFAKARQTLGKKFTPTPPGGSGPT